MTDKIEKAAQRADCTIMELCQPDVMSQAEALDFLGRVIERCRSASEALEEEIENARG